MYYYRHAFEYAAAASTTDDYAVNFYPTLATLGFGGVNGEDISTWTNTAADGEQSWKWTADTQTINNYFCSRRAADASNNYFTYFCSNGSSIALPGFGESSPGAFGLGMTFIPLKNNSFFWNVYCYQPTLGRGVAPNIYLYRHLENKDLDVPQPPTPATASISFAYLKPIIYNTSNYNLYWCFIRSLGTTTSSTDIYGRTRTSPDPDWNVYSITNTSYDFGQGNTPNSATNMNNIIDYTISTQVSDYDKTDVNTNTCVLVKMPYNNSFCENVYLMSTAPQEVKPASFFSFGGRNFMNIWDNIVVELPNN